jgi:hypothetical protein
MYQDLGDDEDLDALRSRFSGADMAASQPWWPQDQSVGELALQIALLVESLGTFPTLGDWALVCLLPIVSPTRCCLKSPHIAYMGW